jgi:hypothetical protein
VCIVQVVLGSQLVRNSQVRAESSISRALFSMLLSLYAIWCGAIASG